MATFKLLLHSANKRKNGSYPVSLRITKNMKHKYISLGLYGKKEEWDEKSERFRCDKRVCPNYKEYNARLVQLLARVQNVELDFEHDKIDWTLNQFESEFLGMSRQGKVYDYFMRQVENLKATKHIGNAKVYERTLRMLAKYDTKIKERVFSELDIKYINRFNLEMEKDGCCGNTRKYYLKTLRAVMNRAIKEHEASSKTYPFGKNGFEIGCLEEETEKRYLQPKDLELLKNSPQTNFVLERARMLFLFSYYCYGMSFVDMAKLTTENIVVSEGIEHIVYKREKTKNVKNMKPLIIPVTPALKDILEWFKQNTSLVGNYLLPIITKDYDGEQLYDHIRTRYQRLNNNLKKLGKILGIEKNLTTYVSRHTMAMTLQGNDVSRETISAVLGHRDIKTTMTYLDSLSQNVLDRVAMLL